MKPYGQKPSEATTGEGRLKSGSTEYVPTTDTFVPLSPDTIRKSRRRLKKKARQEADAEIRVSLDLADQPPKL